MASVFIKVPVSDRLPSYYGLYDINEGILEYSTAGGWLYPQPTPEYWFEEIELPEEEEVNFKYPLNKEELHKTTLNIGCRTGANFILDKLKDHLNEK